MSRETWFTLLLLLVIFCHPVFAGGPVAEFPDDSPCDQDFLTFEQFQMTWVGEGADDGYRLALILRDRACGDVPTPAEMWEARGWTDESLLRAVFNGHSPGPSPAKVPLPGAVAMLLGALALLLGAKRK